MTSLFRSHPFLVRLVVHVSPPDQPSKQQLSNHPVSRTETTHNYDVMPSTPLPPAALPYPLNPTKKGPRDNYAYSVVKISNLYATGFLIVGG